MKQIFRVVVGVFFLVTLAWADAPDTLIKNTVQEVITVIQQDKEIRNGDQKKILDLVDAKILPRFDFSRMTQLAVGKYWRRATPVQRDALIVEFRNMLVRTYAKAFAVYNDQTVEVMPLKVAAGATDVTVKTSINKPGGKGVAVDYEMRKMADDWKVYDVSIEGVSMVMNYRSTFAGEIDQGGIDGLIKTLSERNASADEVAPKVKAAAK
ncbi:MAG: MlaC/ttg2D family ABC transporter substrate-binding protein [Pseudomonadota bacterium]